MRAALTPSVDHVVLRFEVPHEDAYYGWLSYEILRAEPDSATLRLDAIYLPSGPENRLAVPDDLKSFPVFDIGRVF